MFFEVPQYIDIEDKIAFQLTSKQLGWFALGGILIFLAWSVLEKGAFIFTSILIIVATSGMAFVRPYGLSMASFISYGFFYFLRPKIYVWRKSAEKMDLEEENKKNDFKKGYNLERTIRSREKKVLEIDKTADFLDNIQKL